MNNTKIPLHMRAEKTTKNRDDLRVMIAGVLVCIFMLLIQKPVFWLYDHFYAERPFMTATVEIVAVPGRARPMIRYDADAYQHVRGIWIASAHATSSGEDERLFTRRGEGNYVGNNVDDEPKLWTWSAFFDNEKDDWVMPEVPTEPFRICVRYDAATVDSNYQFNTEDHCSEPFDPAIMETLQ